MEYADEIISTRKNAFEAWSTILFIRESDKIKYVELIHDYSIQYAINNNKYLKTLQESVNIMHSEI